MTHEGEAARRIINAHPVATLLANTLFFAGIYLDAISGPRCPSPGRLSGLAANPACRYLGRLAAHYKRVYALPVREYGRYLICVLAVITPVDLLAMQYS
jgi:hypothetical protein